MKNKSYVNKSTNQIQPVGHPIVAKGMAELLAAVLVANPASR